jgi:hypothetical protein
MGSNNGSIPMIFLYQTSEVGQELEYEMYPTEYKVMIGCVMDWPHDHYSYCSLLLWGMVILERHTYIRDDVVKSRA